MESQSNLLSILHRLAWRHDENFVTEAFAHLLRQMLADDAAAATAFINYLTNDQLQLRSELAGSIKIKTQSVEESGRPDIEITATDRAAFIEVKVESELGEAQLSRYRHELAKRGCTYSALVLLTRYAVEIADIAEQPDAYRRWAEIADELDVAASQLPPSSSAHFLTLQFRDFLKHRGMTMEHVSAELAAGVRAFRNLLTMLEEACGKRRKKRDESRDYDGIYVTLDAGRVWVGARFDVPQTIRFASHEYPVLPDAAERLHCGVIEPASWMP